MLPITRGIMSAITNTDNCTDNRQVSRLRDRRAQQPSRYYPVTIRFINEPCCTLPHHGDEFARDFHPFPFSPNLFRTNEKIRHLLSSKIVQYYFTTAYIFCQEKQHAKNCWKIIKYTVLHIQNMCNIIKINLYA